MDKGIETEMEGRALKILGTKCFNLRILKLCVPLWDGMAISIPMGEKSHFPAVL